jgi:lysozyme family protein
MTLFDRAIEVVLKHEGGYVDHPSDPGGATNYGVSLRFLKAEIADGRLDAEIYDYDDDRDIDADDIKALTRDDAIAAYRARFWDPHGWDRFHDIIAIKAFDLSVNMGPRQAIKLLQRACKACSQDIADDGIMGPITVRTVQRVEEDLGPFSLRAALRSEAAGFYRSLIAGNSKFAAFQNGWMRRAYS